LQPFPNVDILDYLFVQINNEMLLLFQAKYRLYHVQKEQVNQLYDTYIQNQIEYLIRIQNISYRVA